MRALLALTFVLSTALVCQASAGQTQMSPADHRETRGFNRLMHQVESLVQAEDFDSAVVVAERALAVVREAHVESDSLLAHASRTLGALYNQVRNLSEARRHYRQWLVIAEKNPHYDQAAFANNIFRLASICRILCLYGEAESYVTRALQIYKAVPQTDDYTMADRFTRTNTSPSRGSGRRSGTRAEQSSSGDAAAPGAPGQATGDEPPSMSCWTSTTRCAGP